MGQQRTLTDSPAGLTLMRSRLYTPTGLFTTTHPEYGGNDTTSQCPTDPINTSDLDSRRGRRLKEALRYLRDQMLLTGQVCAVHCGGATLRFPKTIYMSQFSTEQLD